MPPTDAHATHAFEQGYAHNKRDLSAGADAHAPTKGCLQPNKTSRMDSHTVVYPWVLTSTGLGCRVLKENSAQGNTA
jgi:hypothetical protein